MAAPWKMAGAIFLFWLQNIFPSPMYKTTRFTAYKLISAQIISNKISFMNFYSLYLLQQVSILIC